MFTEIELNIRLRHEDIAEADLYFTPTDQNVRRELARNAPVHFDWPRLLSAELDPRLYGEQLADMLFADSQLRIAWERAAAYTQGVSIDRSIPVRFRLRLDDSLQTFRWELLHDPLSRNSLCKSERILFSRYFDSADLSPVYVPPRPQLKVAAVISSPQRLNQYGLAPFDAAEEAKTLQSSLGSIPKSIIGHEASGMRATLNNIIGTIREGCNIFYMVCHGRLIPGHGPVLYLEDESGEVAPIGGDRFVERIQTLTQMPLFSSF